MRNLALCLSYEGSAYHGWQTQKTEVTIQETLEEALSLVCGHPVKVTGCGRTDAGVHALRYCANFRTDCRIPVDKVPLAVNSRLPRSIAVKACCEVNANFNAISSCIQKEYIYRIHNSRIPDPFLEHRVCFYPQKLNVENMRLAAAAFEGTHDFSAVRSVGTDTRSTIRTVYWCRVDKNEDVITVRICADGFLYNMVRAIVGTLVYSAYGKLSPMDIPRLLELKDRRLTGPTMPPDGLYMNRVWYEGSAGILMGTADENGVPLLERVFLP